MSLPHHRPSWPPQRAAQQAACRLEPLEARVLLSAVITNAFSFGNAAPAPITDMRVDFDNTAYITGTFTDSLDIDPSPGSHTLTSHGGRDIFLAAFKDNSFLWAVALGGPGDEDAGSLIVFQNDVLIAGSFSGTIDADPGDAGALLTSNGGTDALLARFTRAGLFEQAWSFGGPGDDHASRLALDHGAISGLVPARFYLTGTFTGTADLDPGAATLSRTTADPLISESFVSRITADGNLLWTNTYSAADTFTIADVGVTPSTNRLYLAGDFRGSVDLHGHLGPKVISSETYAGYYAELNPSTGQLIRARTFGDLLGPFPAIVLRSFHVDAAGNLLFAGSFGSAVDMDPSQLVHALAETQAPDGLTGFLLKLDAEGAYLWAGALLGDAPSSVSAIATDAPGNIYIAGEFNHLTDFDFDYTAHTITAPHTFNTAFIAKYTAVGDLLWVQRATAGAGLSRATVLGTGSDGLLLAAGEFSTSITFTTPLSDISQAKTTVLNGNAAGNNFLLEIRQIPDRPSPSFITPVPPTHGRFVTGQKVRLWVGFPATPAIPTGTIKFYDHETFLGEAPLDEVGTASFDYIAAPGLHGIQAWYSGDSNFYAQFAGVVNITAETNRESLGGLESPSFGMLTGWAADLDDPNAVLIVQILIDGQLHGSFLAQQDRPDLQPLMSSTFHGFTWQLPPLDAGEHTVTLVAYDPALDTGRELASTSVTSASLFFDEIWYLHAYPDVAAALVAGALTSAWDHFRLSGTAEGRNPSAFFDESWYLAKNPDVAAAIAAGGLFSGFDHFSRAGHREGRDPSVYFSDAWYRRAYTDVPAALAAGFLDSPFAHFLRSGLIEGRSPTAWFHPGEYLYYQADVNERLGAGRLRSAYEHFLSTGMAELRNPSVLFDEAFYLRQSPDVYDAIQFGVLTSGIAHFIAAGMQEGRLSAPHFDETWYRARYPQAVAAISDGLVASAFHYYLLYGRLLGHGVDDGA